MAELGFCPSGRLFEAAACGVPVLSDRWTGLETFFAPGDEIGRRARDRALAEHSGDRRAAELVAILHGQRT